MTFLTSLPTHAQRRPDPTVPDLLAAAAKYLIDYEQQFSVIVSEENYRQTANVIAARGGPTRRELKSDLLMFSTPTIGFIGMRDVIEVDGKPVQDRADRLIKLVTEPSADPMMQLRRVTEESSRYNIGDVARTLNVPTMALLFLRAEYQARSTFKFEGMETVSRLRVAELSFKEESMPRMIQTQEGTPAAGRFWIEPGTGRVVQTEIQLKSARYTATIEVDYADQPKLGLWVPVRMTENYVSRGAVTPILNGVRIQMTPSEISGRADYRNFRRFQVDTATIIKK